MTAPIDRLRAADPAADLGPQPDERAEADLRLLLAEPRRTAAPRRRTERRRLAPVLVTAVVAIAVIALTAAVLGSVHPRTDVGGSTPPSIVPTLSTSACHPAEVLPFRCGTYESTYGGKAITGDLGGPAKGRLLLSFTPEDGALLLTARTTGCFAETVLVRYQSKRLVRVGAARYSQNGCFGRGPDMTTWAAAFLRGPLDVTGVDGPTFGTGDTSVFFEYQGEATMGGKQLPRNDRSCVPAHVQPFSCGTYRATGGTGTLEFLDSSRFTLSFTRLNAQLTAALDGGCNTLGVGMAVDGDTIVVEGTSATDVGCLGDRGRDDGLMSTFFTGVLTYRVTGDTVTFTNGSSSATFSNEVGACLPTPATSPFCGASTSTGGSGSLAFLGTDHYRLHFQGTGDHLVATVQGGCNTMTYAVEADATPLRFRPLSATRRPCPTTGAAHDAAIAAFLAAPMTYRDVDGTLTLGSAASGPYSSAVFAPDR